MFKRKGGVKGFLNNVKKKLHFSYTEASLSSGFDEAFKDSKDFFARKESCKNDEIVLPPITEGFIKYSSGGKGLMNKTPKIVIVVIVKGCPSLMLAMSMMSWGRW